MAGAKKVKLNMSAKLLLVTVLPLILLAVIVGGVTSRVIAGIILEQSESDMASQALMIERMYDNLYPGDYSVETYLDSYYTVQKGGYDISGSGSMLDNIKYAYGDEITIFRGGTAVITTIQDADGNRMNLQQVSAVVEHEVYLAGESKFYSDVLIDGDSYFAYFTPLVNSDREIFGMLGIYRLSSDIDKRVRSATFPVLLTFIPAVLLIALINLHYSTVVVRRIKGIRKFLNMIASGRFDEDISDRYLKGEDELSDLAKSGSKMRQELSLLVEYDALTELYNRRYATGRLHRMSEEGDTDFCMCIGDIDFFKRVNDTYGHDAGDEVLKAVAHSLKSSMAGKGFVARWGGEEFLIVFLHMDIAAATEALSEALERIREIEVVSGENIIKVTMSFGITGPDSGADYDSLIKEADERLYYSKTHGRNRITSVHVTEVNNALDALDRR